MSNRRESILGSYFKGRLIILFADGVLPGANEKGLG